MTDNTIVGPSDSDNVSYTGGDPFENNQVLTTRKFYDGEQKRLRWLDALEQAGVDNWDGIYFAREIYNSFK